jgi:trans-2,3-dihydro-3-hydroxyanthranilate isomerase
MSNGIQYFILDVFTSQAFAGNQLAVFPSSDGLESRTMQSIANELNLAETVFVGSARQPNRYPIRIFTPAMELPFAGHPTVGTAHLLAELGLASGDCPLILEAGVGPLAVTFENDLAWFTTTQAVEIKNSTLSRNNAAQLLGLEDSGVISEPVLASCGLPYHLIELDSLKSLELARPSPDFWANWVSPSGYDQIYLYVSLKASDHGDSLRSRMFSTPGGVCEDPATGSAAAALVGVLVTDKPGAGVWRWEIQQGIEMGRPSQIFAEAERDGSGAGIRIGGKAVVVGSGAIKSSATKSWR